MLIPSPPVVHEVDSRGELRIWAPNERLLVSSIKGMFCQQFTSPFLRAADAWYARHGRDLYNFNDWEEMSDYEGTSRSELTGWLLKRRHSYAGVHFLLRSRLVSLGVQIANFALGNIFTVHPNRASFERALRDRITMA